MRCSRFLILLALPCAAAVGCATTGGADRAAPASPPPSFFQKAVDADKILVGGQPTASHRPSRSSLSAAKSGRA